MKKLVSMRELSRILGISRENLEEVAESINAHYHEWPHTDRKTGKVRTISSPSKALKNIQKRIGKRLFNAVKYGSEVQGGIRGRSPKTNAAIHLQKPCLITIDVRKFFPSVRHTVVYRMLRTEFGFGRDVAALVTRLVTHNGQLPQGAPTSTVIANALLRIPVDLPALERAHDTKSSYSRFVDDLAVSGRDPREMINLIAHQLSKRQLAISRKSKLKIMPSCVPQEITGLLVNGNKPSLSRKKRDSVRAAIHALQKMPESNQRRKAVRSVLGRIAYVKQFNPGSGKRLELQLGTINRPPCNAMQSSCRV